MSADGLDHLIAVTSVCLSVLKRNVGCESTPITRGASLENNYRVKMTIYIPIG